MKAVIGVGNRLKGDDNIGNVVLARLGNLRGVKKLKGAPENLTAPLRKLSPSEAYLIDAVDFRGRPGEVRLYKLGDTDTPFPSTHSFPVQALRILLPQTEFFVIGIQPHSMEFSTKISGELSSRMGQIVEDVRAVILR